MTARTHRFWYLFLRWTALLWGGVTCLAVLVTQAVGLPWGEICFLAAVLTLTGLRSTIMKRASDGAPTLFHSSGDALLVIALLRHGPAAALTVKLLSTAVTFVIEWRSYRRDLLRFASNGFYFPALFWAAGLLYGALGGHTMLSPADSAAFFQRPTLYVLPLIGMLVVNSEMIHRVYTAFVLYHKSGVPLRQTFMDPFFSCFDYLENISGALMLALWTDYGWGSVPFMVLMHEAAMAGVHSHFQRLEAQRAAESDPLTGLASWRGLENALDRRLRGAQIRPAPFAVLFLDVDGLKRVNDRFGHGVGDDLLRLVGETCQAHAREGDAVGRRGGDEFLLILRDSDREVAERVMSRLQWAFAEAVAGHPQFSVEQVGLSAGMAVYPGDAGDAPGLIAFADRQMYQDKQARGLSRSAA